MTTHTTTANFSDPAQPTSTQSAHSLPLHPKQLRRRLGKEGRTEVGGVSVLGVSSGYSVWGTSRSRTVFPLPLRLGHSDPRLHLSVFGCRLHPRLSSQSLASLGAACGAKRHPTNTFWFEERQGAPFRFLRVGERELTQRQNPGFYFGSSALEKTTTRTTTTLLVAGFRLVAELV